MKIFHDIIFAATDEGDDAAIISDAFGTGKSFDLENEEGDDEFCLMYQIKGKKAWFDEEEGGIISDQTYADKDDKSGCEVTYDIVNQYNLEELAISIVGYNKAVKKYMKACLKALEKGPVKKAIKTNGKKFCDKAAEGGFYNFVKAKGKDNITFLARQGTESLAMEGQAMIVVADMEDWKAPTYYFFGPGLQGKSC